MSDPNNSSNDDGWKLGPIRVIRTIPHKVTDLENHLASRALAVELAEALQAMVMAAREHKCGLAIADEALARARLAGLLTDRI